MARVTARVGRPRSPRARRLAVRQSLAASATPLLTSFEMTQGSPAERYFAAVALAAGHVEYGGDQWPCEIEGLASEPEPEFRDGTGTAVYRFGDTLALVHLGHGWCSVRVAAPAPDAVAVVCAAFRGRYPASYLTQTDDTRVPITFWSMSKWGAQPRLRRVEAATWAAIERNYPSDVRDELGEVMAWHDGPGRDGQLMLWQGPPGTGKTWCLRALASEWASWCEFNYITDPDAFFVEDASYMIDVLLSDSYAAIEPDSGDVYEEEKADGKWRVLILEDTGELLSANAKEKYGQGLSRLLNVVDGMIGQGLRVLALVTTNDELGELAPAVVRPGRCASKLVFGPLTDAEARAWTGDPSAEGGTLAELYSRYGEEQDALPADEPEDELVASLRAEFARPVDRPDEPTYSLGRADDTVAAIQEVAAAHADEAVGYGETAWDADTRTVLYVCGDWTNPDPIAADMLAIDGVDGFVHEAEALPDGWWDAEVVYPDDPARWVTEPPDRESAALTELVALAAAPLERPVPPAPLVQTGPDVMALLAAAVEALGSKPAAPIHVHIGSPDLHVSVDPPESRFDVHLPATSPAAAPEVHVHVPEQAPAAVEVHVPEQPAPVVTVTNEVPVPSVTVEARPERTVAVPIRDDDGRIVRVEHRPEA